MSDWVEVRLSMRNTPLHLATVTSEIDGELWDHFLKLYSNGYKVKTLDAGWKWFREIPNPHYTPRRRRRLLRDRYLFADHKGNLRRWPNRIFKDAYDWAEDVILTDSFYRFR